MSKDNNDESISTTEGYPSGSLQCLWEFEAMNNLIDENRDGVYIQQQLKEDRINVILRKDTTKKELAQYLHKTCCSPTPATFLAVI